MSLERAKDLVDVFNNGDFYEDIEPYFNDVITFYKFIKKYGLLGELDLGQISHRDWDDELIDFLDESGVLSNLSYDDAPEELKNVLLLRKLDEDYEGTILFIINNLLTDVEIRNGGFYLYLRGREELANFYCGSNRRSDGVRYVAEQVFSEEGLDYDRFWDTSDDVYVDVIETLDGANTEILKKYIIRHIGNQDLNIENYSADFFHELMKSQGREDFFQITDNDVKSLIDDSEAMNELLDGDLSELKGELDSIHSNAYNAAYESKVYDLVMGGLGEYFSSRINEVEKQIGEKTRYIPYIKIRSFYNNVITFLNEYKGYTDTLEYYGSYTEMMKQLFISALQKGVNSPTPYDLVGEMGAGVKAYWSGATMATAPLPIQPAIQATVNLSVTQNIVTNPGIWQKPISGPSVISEEFGVIAIILLLILFLFFIYTVFKKIYLEKSEKIKLVLTGIISLLIFQALIHFGVNIRLLPTTGMTLPFLSYGGSSIIGVSILSGIILNLTKRKVN